MELLRDTSLYLPTDALPLSFVPHSVPIHRLHQVLGDFNGWIPQPLLQTDPIAGRNFHVEPLTVGRCIHVPI
jgi:hypothetical protein